jgi:hypothetical protein
MGAGDMTVNVLGTPYEITITCEEKEPRLAGCSGFCDETTHKIFAESFEADKGKPDTKENLNLETQRIIRHEIVHAFLCESGLACDSFWAQNEEMVDWIAKQGLKIHKAWKEAGAI